MAIAPLVERLLAERPDLSVLVTSTTPTGAEQVQQKLGGRVEWCWAPLDTPGAVTHFLERWHSTLGALVETEIWPNLINVSNESKLPVVLVNGRLSDKSLKKYQRLSSFFKGSFNKIDHAFVQSKNDFERFF